MLPTVTSSLAPTVEQTGLSKGIAECLESRLGKERSHASVSNLVTRTPEQGSTLSDCFVFERTSGGMEAATLVVPRNIPATSWLPLDEMGLAQAKLAR